MEEIIWKTYEELNAWERMELRTGRIFESKIEKRKIYYKVK